jgi:hypothetical protein
VVLSHELTLVFEGTGQRSLENVRLTLCLLKSGKITTAHFSTGSTAAAIIPHEKEMAVR